MLLVFPYLANATECSLDIRNEKIEYIPGEIIYFEVGFDSLENKTIKSYIIFLKYDNNYLEFIGEHKVAKTEDNISYIQINRDAIEEISFKVKHKVPSGVSVISLLGNDYKSSIITELESEEESALYCKEKNINLKINNKNDDAFLSKVKLTFVGEENESKEIINFDNLDMTIGSDITSLIIETECSGKDCKVLVDNEIPITTNSLEIPIVVETNTSIRNYYLRLTRSENVFDEEKDVISTVDKIENVDVESYNSFTILILFIIIVVVLVSCSVLFIVYAKKKM